MNTTNFVISIIKSLLSFAKILAVAPSILPTTNLLNPQPRKTNQHE